MLRGCYAGRGWSPLVMGMVLRAVVTMWQWLRLMHRLLRLLISMSLLRCFMGRWWAVRRLRLGLHRFALHYTRA